MQEESRSYKPSSHVTVFQPGAKSMAGLGSELVCFLGTDTVEKAWFYSPAFVSILDAINFDLVIYDCMDELTLFRNASSELVVQEKKLMRWADVVFTGGKSLYEAKKKLHSNVYCFPSSVDTAHFLKAQNGIAIPEDISSIKGPIAGYHGVIDERIDLDLIRETALQNQDVHFVFIGPLAKISAEELPVAHNIHFLGMRTYEQLPNYLKRFDIAIMPFALNESTRFISPTKTLEYMAAGKPVISTRIEDVVKDYSECIELVSNPAEFSEKIRNILDSGKRNRFMEYTHILKKTSWQQTVTSMQNILNYL